MREQDGKLTDELRTAETGGTGAMRAKDVCHALGLGTEPTDTEDVRAKLKRLFKRRILTEAEQGLFAPALRAADADHAGASD